MLVCGCKPKLTLEQRRQRLLATVDEVSAKGPFRPAWDSLESFQVPQWCMDGKFGVFIHWGVYSAPAFQNEWYPRNMYLEDQPAFEHHVKTYGPQLRFGYKDFIPRFRGERFDPGGWADLFRRAGAKYVVPVAEHHDGFAMWASELTGWSAAKMGPRRDVIGELSKAVRKRGMVFGVSSHRAEHWWYFEGGMQFASDVREPANAGLYGPAYPRYTGYGDESQPDQAFLDDWLERTVEIVENYKPQLVYFDWWIEQPAFQPYLQRFAAYYYNRGAGWKQQVAINYKNNAFPERAAILDVERGVVDSPRSRFWQTDTSVSKLSWGYIKNDQYRTANELIDSLADIVSKNGALLLNVGPAADGVIPEPEERVLLDIGRWLAVNGEAIYGSRPWKTYGEGPTPVASGSFKESEQAPFTSRDIRFTRKGKTVYAIFLDWPAEGRLEIHSLAAEPVRSVELLGAARPLKWSRTAEALVVELPAARPCEHAFTLRIAP